MQFGTIKLQKKLVQIHHKNLVCLLIMLAQLAVIKKPLRGAFIDFYCR
jgi:hypothetical protein